MNLLVASCCRPWRRGSRAFPSVASWRRPCCFWHAAAPRLPGCVGPRPRIDTNVAQNSSTPLQSEPKKNIGPNALLSHYPRRNVVRATGPSRAAPPAGVAACPTPPAGPPHRLRLSAGRWPAQDASSRRTLRPRRLPTGPCPTLQRLTECRW